MLKHSTGRTCFLLLVCLLASLSLLARAQSCTAEVESNDEPAQAQPIAGCVAGQLAVDNQDFYVFTVETDAARQLFTFSVEVIPGALTRVDLFRLTAAGARPESLFAFQTPDGSVTRTNPVMLAPGAYLLAVNTTDAGEYILSVTKGDSLPAPGEVEPNDSRDAATLIEGSFDLSGELTADQDWFVWTPPASAPESRWIVTAQTAASTSLELWLYDSANAVLARVEPDEWGRAALYDLSLAEGPYFLRLNSRAEAGAPYRLSAEMVEVPFANYETEPNNEVAQAQTWSLADLLRGRLAAPGDTDQFRIRVDEAQAGQVWQITLESNSRQQRRLCLEPSVAGIPAHCRDGVGAVALVDLALPAGEHLVSVSGEADPDEQYTLMNRVTGTIVPGVEAEPNDTYQQASAFGEGHRARGRFGGDERDMYHLLVTGQPQLWRVQAIGDGLTQLSYINTAGQWVQSVQADSQRRLRLSNLYLLPGSHFFEVRGTSGDYRLVTVPLGPPPPGLELEPNDATGQANRLRLGEARIGLLVEADDEDFYRFSLASEEHVTLTITPPEDGLIETQIQWSGLTVGGQSNPTAGELFVFESILPAGDYEVRLFSPNSTDSPYTILLERGDPFATVIDREPNDSLPFASPVPASLLVHGAVGARYDYDWYALPVIANDATLDIHSASRVDLALYNAESNVVDGFAWDGERQHYAGMLDAFAPQPFYLRVAGSGPYELQLRFEGMPEPAPASELTADLELALDENAVAAHWYAGQVVNGVLRVANRDSIPLDLLLDSHSSHHKLAINLAETQVSLSPGASTELPLQIVVAADLPTDNYPITLRARTATGDQVTAAVSLSAFADAAPVGQQWIWPVPESMLGGLNVAALAFGAAVLTDDRALAESQHDLHDGYTALQYGFRDDARRMPLTLTIQLAGADPVPVTGILLNPQSDGEDPHKLRDFELWLSVDGQTFTPVLSGRLSALPIEQAFPLSEPTLARYAQLRLLSNHAGNAGNVELGEWKVVAAPGWSPGDRLNIADPQRGGYIVYNTPQHNQATDVASLLAADQMAYRFNLPAESEAEWVLGFHHDRAAQITDIEWIEAPDTPPAERLMELTVWASLESPVGPWTPLGTWALTPETSVFTLPEPTWARYVRLAASAPTQNTRLTAPDAIRVWERLVDDSYRSVVGEWGHYSRAGVYEWLHPVAASLTETEEDANDSREQAATLQAGQQIHGQAQIGDDVDWYRIEVPVDRNAVTLHVTGDPTVRVRVVFEDSVGNPLPATVEHLSPSEQTITALAPPGETVYFRVEEPPRSVIFTWDTSASVSAYYDTIYNALTAFIEGVTPGREVANFLPFGGSVLLETWGEQPAALQQALNDYNRAHNSSNVEGALLAATEELALREGTKAIIIITDAVSGSYNLTADLWSALRDVRPRIFALHISSQLSVGEKPANEQDLMQSWTSINGGYYDFLRNQADMEIAFERATIWLRRPANYTFIADVRYVEPPGPGTLQILSGTTSEAAALRAERLSNTTVEIILDASWSMVEPLNGRRRIDVAREALLDLVNRVLPEGTPLALRVFGNREGDFACRTDLEVPLQPLDRTAVQAIIEDITPQTNANTAIAASLLMVPDDLAGASGHKVVILLTDGQETCGGDPEAAIAALRNRDVNVRLNIVGFAVTDETLKSQFEHWAELGDGQYFDAGSAEALSASLEAALGVPYQVLGADGQVVAEGIVDGGPVTLPAGVYTVEVLTEPVRTIENVMVGGEADVVVRLQE